MPVLAMLSFVLFVAAILWPALALGWVCLDQAHPPRDGWTMTPGQLLLLIRTALLALAGVATCLPPAIAAGVLIGSQRPRPAMVAAIAAGLLCPPMAYAFGWLRLLPVGVDPHIRCVLTWTLWTWPAAALIIAAGWARTAREPYLAATLCTSPLRAWLHVGLPSMRTPILLVALILFVLFFGDYGVPHSFGLRVYSTELLAWSSESFFAMDALWPALPSILLTATALIGILHCLQRNRGTAWNGTFRKGSPFLRWIVFLVMLAGWLAPLLALMRPLTLRAFTQTWQTYVVDLFSTIGVATVAGTLVMLLGVGFSTNRRFHTLVLFAAMLFGALPGSVVAQAIIAAYNRPLFGWVYDHWPVVSLVHVARYAWIGLLISYRLSPASGNETVDQARIDGASEFQVFRFVLIPQHASLLLCGAAIVVALSVGDVAASTLVRVPGYNPIAHVIIEKFHRFEDGALISLCLMLVGLAALASLVVARLAANRLR